MNRIKRLYYILRLFMIPKAEKRVDFLRKKNIFGYIGENVLIQNRVLPLHCNLIHIHNNVKIASKVTFVTHDIIYKMLNCKYSKPMFSERIGCIELMDNVFIGSGTTIMYDVRIGNNVIIGAGSVVTKDVPDNCVYAGIPAKYICSIDDFEQKANHYTCDFEKKYNMGIPVSFASGIPKDISIEMYNDFRMKRK